jgi:hypothetical protein
LENGHDIDVRKVDQSGVALDSNLLMIFDGESGFVEDERLTHEVLGDSGNEVAVVFPSINVSGVFFRAGSPASIG